MAQRDDGPLAGGQGFLRAMADQSARAHDFDRRMRWFWLRWLLTDRSPDDAPTPGAVTSSGAPVVPRQVG